MANLSNINNKFLVTAGGNVLIGQTADAGKKLYVYNTASADVALLESTQVFSTLAFKSSTNASTVTIGIDGAGNAAFENKLAAGKITFVTNGAERMQIDSSGNTTITTISNQGGLTVTSATDNTVLGINNTATGGQAWRLQSIGGGSGSGQGKLLIKVGGGEAAANLISFVTDSSGNNIKMGIGTTSPVQKLTVQGSSTAAAGRFTAGGNTNTLEIFGHTGTGQSSGLLVNAGTNTADYAARFRNAAGSVIMNIRGDGNVGIGTDDPQTNLEISDASGAALTIRSQDNVNGYSLINFGDSDDDNVGRIYYGHDDNAMRFRTNDSEKMRLTSGARINMDVMAGHESEGIIRIGRYDANTTRYNEIKSYISSTAASNYLKFSVHGGVESAVVDVMTLLGSGQSTFYGSVGLNSGATFNVKLQQNAHSTVLSNSAYSNAAAVQAYATSTTDVYPGYGFHKASALGAFLYATSRTELRLRGDGGTDKVLLMANSDYEEGTWTPVIDGSTSVSGQSYSRQEGSYTKVGNMITAWFSITLTAKGTIAGFLRISGLPLNGSATPVLKPAAVSWSNMSMTANHQLSAEQYTANPFMYLFEMDASGSKDQIQTGAITDTTFISGTLTYRV